MKKGLLTKLFGLGIGLALSVGAITGASWYSKSQLRKANAEATNACSFSRSGTSDTTDGGTFTKAADNKSGYYQDGSNDPAYLQILSSSAYWTVKPESISFTAKLGGGTTKNPLANNVFVALLDQSGNEISSTSTVVTTKIENTTGKEYTVTIPNVDKCYGVKISHAKDSGYNVRYYSFSLSYVAGTAKTLTSLSIEKAPNKTQYFVGQEFDPTGAVVKASYDVGDPVDVTEEVTWTPTGELTKDITKVTASFTDGEVTKKVDQAITVLERTLNSVEINGTLNKTSYFVGDDWDLNGLNLKLNWSLGDAEYVELNDDNVSYELTPEKALSAETTSFDLCVLYGDDLLEDTKKFNVTVTEKPKEYVLDLDGGQTHGTTNSSASATIDTLTNFNVAFPQADDVNVEYVSSSKAYSTTFSKGLASTQALKLGSSGNPGNIKFRLTNSDREYVTELVLDAYSYNGDEKTFTISATGETSVSAKLKGYSDDLRFDLSSWDEPTEFTITCEERATLFGLKVKYDLKGEKAPITSYTVDSNAIELNENTLTHQIVNTILPENAEQDVIYSVDYPSVITISDEGLIRALTAGTVTITCTTVGKDSSGKVLTQQIVVNVTNNATTFTLNAASAEWPTSSSDSYATKSSNLINYSYRRFQAYTESSVTYLELNKHGTSATSVEPTFGNSIAYNSPIKSIVITYQNSTQAGYGSVYASSSNTSSNMKKDLKVIPSTSSAVCTYKFEDGNYNFFTLVNDANEYMKMSSIVITLKNENETAAGLFIKNYMHPEISKDSNGTGECKTSGWYSDAKTAFASLDSGIKEAFAETSYAQRLEAWAIANGETFNAETGAFSSNRSVFGSIESDDTSAMIVVIAAIAGTTLLGFGLISKKRKQTY